VSKPKLTVEWLKAFMKRNHPHFKLHGNDIHHLAKRFIEERAHQFDRDSIDDMIKLMNIYPVNIYRLWLGEKND
jgi:disulfide oxidoreductase YuzD|tara:strand:+ start:60 stop:281 length:222 start_codon:yes stop_codon:yes gene_type:complete